MTIGIGNVGLPERTCSIRNLESVIFPQVVQVVAQICYYLSPTCACGAIMFQK